MFKNVDLYFEDSYNVEPRVSLIRQRRFIRNYSNPMELPATAFITNFRLNKEAFMFVLDKIKNKFHCHLSSSITPMLKLCCALRFFAHGSYQQTVENEFQLGLAQPTVSLILKEILPILESEICSVLINTEMTEEEKQQAKSKYISRSGIPNVIGCVHGMHIAICAPNANKHLYLNRKGVFSINALIACDHDMNIRFVDARFPGSTHDSFVWNNSSLKSYLENMHQTGDHKSIYLGDSGFPLSPYLLTPFRQAESGTRESSFNEKHAKAINVVERAIGVLKCRFRCLLSDRKMRYDPAKVTSIINICSALHNVCKKFRISDPEEAEILIDSFVPSDPINENAIDTLGERRRRQIADALL
ncbi:putative nuclease HARBI1 [Anastrepha ludens]|uniref:putative nuclease HARBI1 n=1 Tax=Anastrepha ludens TaxID=28586 RepID=UPI0023B006F1|nr:putative nuclease HARBI1 [Anastrepha ludens]